MVKRFISELIGTYGLVFCGTGAIIINDLSNGSITHLGIAITFGLIVMSMILAFGESSGAHINPAVSIAFWAAGLFKGKNLIYYIASQFIGAIAASFSLQFLFPNHANLGATLPSYGLVQCFALETLLTFFLMLVILRISTGSKEIGIHAGLAIGSVVLLEALFAGPVTGASMNPFRSLAPALVSSNFYALGIYLTAPILGALLAVPIWKVLKED